jgi:hypothetical protein
VKVGYSCAQGIYQAASRSSSPPVGWSWRTDQLDCNEVGREKSSDGIEVQSRQQLKNARVVQDHFRSVERSSSLPRVPKSLVTTRLGSCRLLLCTSRRTEERCRLTGVRFEGILGRKTVNLGEEMSLMGKEVDWAVEMQSGSTGTPRVGLELQNGMYRGERFKTLLNKTSRD